MARRKRIGKTERAIARATRADTIARANLSNPVRPAMSDIKAHWSQDAYTGAKSPVCRSMLNGERDNYGGQASRSTKRNAPLFADQPRVEAHEQAGIAEQQEIAKQRRLYEADCLALVPFKLRAKAVQGEDDD